MKVQIIAVCLVSTCILFVNGQLKYGKKCKTASDCDGDANESSLVCDYSRRPCTDGVCACRDDRFQNGNLDRCCPTDKPIYCSNDKSCYPYINFGATCKENAQGQCNNGMDCDVPTLKCVCQAGFKEIPTYKKLCIPDAAKLVGEVCTTDPVTDCRYITGDELSSGPGTCDGTELKCACPVTHDRVGTTAKCNPKTVGSSCSVKTDCALLGALAGYDCTGTAPDQTCQCVGDYENTGGLCLIPPTTPAVGELAFKAECVGTATLAAERCAPTYTCDRCPESTDTVKTTCLAANKVNFGGDCGSDGNCNVEAGRCFKNKCACQEGKVKETDTKCRNPDLTRGQCEPGWVQRNAFCYFFNSINPNTRDYASDDCTLHDADLVQILDTAEKNWILQQVKSTTIDGWWTGLQWNPEVGDYWHWQDYNLTSDDDTVVSWLAVPRRPIDKRMCAVLYQNGTFIDNVCNDTAHYICKAPLRVTGCGSWVKGGHKCYFFSKAIFAEYDEARQKCLDVGADMLKIENEDDKKVVNDLSMKYTIRGGPQRPYGHSIGMTDRATEGTWLWADGSPVNQSLINWNSEPNGQWGDPRCTEIYRFGNFNDLRCEAKIGYICELPRQTPVDECPASWIYWNSSCYFISNTNDQLAKRTQAEAKMFCERHSATLLILDSTAELEFLKQKFWDLDLGKGGWHTDLEDPEGIQDWRFVNAPTLMPDFDNIIKWITQPDNVLGIEHCAIMYEESRLNDFQCNKSAMFICERTQLRQSPGGYNATCSAAADCWQLSGNAVCTDSKCTCKDDFIHVIWDGETNICEAGASIITFSLVTILAAVGAMFM